MISRVIHVYDPRREAQSARLPGGVFDLIMLRSTKLASSLGRDSPLWAGIRVRSVATRTGTSFYSVRLLLPVYTGTLRSHGAVGRCRLTDV